MNYPRIFLSIGLYGLLTSLLMDVVKAFPKRIPIGALFDNESSLHVRTAFRYEIEKHNNGTNSGFKLDKYEKIIDIADSYSLGRAICSTMAKGIFALFGVTNATSLSTVKSYCNTFHMPYVTPSAPVNDSEEPGFLLKMRPSYDSALNDIIKYYKWTRIYYIYDTQEGLSRLERLYKIVNREDWQVEIDVVRIVNVEHCYALLRELDSRMPSGDKNIILDLSTEHSLELVLNQIQSVGMNRKNYHYVLGGLSMDELDLEAFRYGGVNITGFRLVDPDRDNVKQVQREWSRLNPNYWKGAGTDRKIKLDAALTMDAVSVIVKGITNMLKKDPDVFRNTFRRGQVYNNGTRGINCKSDPAIPWKHGPAIIRHFKGYRIEFQGVTGLVAFDDNGMRRDYTLDVLQLKLNDGPKKIGTWSSKDGITIKEVKTPIVTDDESEENRTRVVTSILSSPYMMIRKEPDEGGPLIGNDRYEGFCADLAKLLSKMVGFDYVLQLVKDGKYGVKMADGTWNGMVGELTDRKADLAMAPLTISSMRERVIDFSKPFMSLGISIMIKKPEKQKPGVFSFMDPLSYEIWMCIIFAYLGVSIVLFLVSRFSPYEWQIEDSVNGPTFTNDFTILNSLWFSLGAFMRQGCDVSPRLV